MTQRYKNDLYARSQGVLPSSRSSFPKSGAVRAGTQHHGYPFMPFMTCFLYQMSSCDLREDL